jgi:hypothetical protein
MISTTEFPDGPNYPSTIITSIARQQRPRFECNAKVELVEDMHTKVHGSVSA